jgi:hypothetical protein
MSRKNPIDDLEKKIEAAIQNALPATFCPETCSAIEIDEAAKYARDFFHTHDYAEGELEGDEPNEVSVDNHIHYKILLRLGIMAVSSKNYGPLNVDYDAITPLVEQLYLHELEHAKPALAQPGISVRYCIAFYRDKNSGLLLYEPRTGFYGRITSELHRIITAAPTELSNRDKITLGR